MAAKKTAKTVQKSVAKKKSAAKKVPKQKAAKKAPKQKGAKEKQAKVLSAAELAALFGITVQKPLKKEDIWRLRKAVPGYAAMLDDAADMLEAEGDALQIADVSPADLLAAQEEQKFLAAREAVLYTVYRGVYEQRLRVDDRAMKMLEKIARRVTALKEDEPALTQRWKLLLDFLATFRRGSNGKQEPAPEPVEEPAAPAPADA
ncbi:MAG: hypothetical protein QM820_22075 [Minicystis sp.]